MRLLIASVPVYGHVTPLLGAARGLVEKGHEVRFLTGRDFAAAVEATGATFVPLPPEIDAGDRAAAASAAEPAGDDTAADPDAGADAVAPQAPAKVAPPPAPWHRRALRRLKAATRARLAAYVRDNSSAWSGIAGMRYGLVGAFVWPARLQYGALLAEIDDGVDAVIADPLFIGALMLAGRPRAERPAVFGAGVIPLTLGSRYVPPFGLGLMPWRGRFNTAHNAVLRAFVQKVALRGIQKKVDEIFRSIHDRPLEVFAFDWFALTEGVLQFSVPSFEYPRPDAVVPIRFTGPLATRSASSFDRPDWWGDLETARAVVLVTQGTIANLDLTELIRPTIDGLAGDDVIVVVTTGGAPVATLGDLPPNVRAAPFLPYDALLPLVSVLVTNGGYGGVHFAFSHGVPVVVAGASEDKPEVAARVVWSGAGLNLHTGRPSPHQVAAAVREAISDPRYREAALMLGAEIAAARGADEIEDAIDTAVPAANRG